MNRFRLQQPIVPPSGAAAPEPSLEDAGRIAPERFVGESPGALGLSHVIQQRDAASIRRRLDGETVTVPGFSESVIRYLVPESSS